MPYVEDRPMTKQPCTIAVFPMPARRQEIRRAAETLNRTHGEAAVVYWKALVRSIADQLSDVGIPAEQVREQVFEFQAQVQQELRAIG
jgi:hypothetical protein